MMDVRVDHRAVDPNSLAVLDALLLRVNDDESVHPFERGRLHTLDVLSQRRLRGRDLHQADAAESSKRRRIAQMEGQIVVAPTVHLLERRGAQHLLAAHAGAPGLRRFGTLDQVRGDQPGGLRQPVEDLRDSGKLAGMWMVDDLRDKTELRSYVISHRCCVFW
jgi:hypothetical protein